jgi:hypothetical protein
MLIPATLASLTQSWSDFYANHQAVSVTVRFLHLTGLIIGGGTALVGDRQVLMALRAGTREKAALLPALHAAHRVVVPSLGLVVLTGILMTAADSTMFLSSRLYWTKLSLVALLLTNGGLLVAAESRVTQHAGERGWGWLAAVSGLSLVLWLLILHLGVWLTVAA